MKMGGSYSAAFDSDVGILAGDGASPSVWDFFGFDFSPGAHPDDISFGDRNVEHADDRALWSTSTAVVYRCTVMTTAQGPARRDCLLTSQRPRYLHRTHD